MAPKSGPLRAWMTGKFLAWQVETGEPQSAAAFAAHVGISQSLMSKIMNGTRDRVEDATANMIAARLGPEIYDVLGMPRPDPLAQAVIAHWGKLSAEQLETLRKWVEMLGVRIEARSDPEHGRIKVSEGTDTRQAGRRRK